jgi:predicted transcriptional regulator of viral defense system
MQLHDLTEQVPKAVYFNVEQARRGGGGQLVQARIDNAFRGKPRETSNVAAFRNQRIHLLNGQNTARLAVVDLAMFDSWTVRVTSIERTLIDATVRPNYSGGVFEVAKAFRLAHGRFSVNRLVAVLRNLDFTYPYHQAIGYYLERASLYKDSQIELLRQFPKNFDFYLDYGMKSPVYDARWRLFLPQKF